MFHGLFKCSELQEKLHADNLESKMHKDRKRGLSRPLHQTGWFFKSIITLA